MSLAICKAVRSLMGLFVCAVGLCTILIVTGVIDGYPGSGAWFWWVLGISMLVTGWVVASND